MSFLNRMRLRNKLALGFAVPALMIAIISAVSIFSLGRLNKASDWVEHTHVAIEYGTNLIGAMVDMETGLRGFLIAGDEVFLEPYEGGQQVFDNVIAKARKHVSDNPAQVARLDEISALRTSWIQEHAQPAIALRQQVNQGIEIDQAFAVLSARTVGKDKFDAFRAAIAELMAAFEQSNDAQAQSLVQSILLSMVNQETGQRGFLLTGQEISLEPYVQGLKDFDDYVSQLSTLIDQRGTSGVAEQLQKAIANSKEWSSGAAQPEIDMRRKKNAFPQTINDVAEFIGQGLGKKSMDAIRVVVADFTNAEKALIEVRQDEASSISAITKNISIIGAILAIASSIIIVLAITRNVGHQLGAEPRTVEGIANAIADGDLSQNLQSEAPVTGVFKAMQTMQANLKQRIEADALANAEMARIKEALQSASSAVVITDATSTVIFQNSAATALFQRMEADVKRTLPTFHAQNLQGLSLNRLQNAIGARDITLSTLSRPVDQDVKFASYVLHQVASPVYDESGKAVGVVMEWVDRTAEDAVEKEIAQVVQAATAGDLSVRLETQGKSGFNAMLSEQMNALLKVSDAVIEDTVRVFEALSACDLSQTIDREYQGSFARLKDHANKTIHQLTHIIASVKSNTTTLDTATVELSTLNQNMHNTAESSAHQAEVVAAAADLISANINNVASAGEQMSASIREIARNASEATRIAGNAVTLAEATDATVRKLGVSSGDIGNVIKVINSIAEQTNLLALNATIEAARAGDAGKGFAVVANEVKELAKETAKATDEIEKKIATIQTDSESAASAIASIDKIIQDINDIQITTSTAVEEQASTTNEIVRSITDAAHGSSDIVDSIALASDGATKTLTSSNNAQISTSELSELSGSLRRLVDQFKLAS